VFVTPLRCPAFSHTDGNFNLSLRYATGPLLSYVSGSPNENLVVWKTWWSAEKIGLFYSSFSAHRSLLRRAIKLFVARHQRCKIPNTVPLISRTVAKTTEQRSHWAVRKNSCCFVSRTTAWSVRDRRAFSRTISFRAGC